MRFHFVSCSQVEFKNKRSLLRSARWRNAPASEQQKKFVAKRWGIRGSTLGGVASEDLKEKRIAKLTKGEASNIITRLKHGAKVTVFYYFVSTNTDTDVFSRATRRRRGQ